VGGNLAGEITGLFKQVGRVAMNLGLVSLNQVMLDGTDIKANNPGAGPVDLFGSPIAPVPPLHPRQTRANILI
jgi:hypothetical protein